MLYNTMRLLAFIVFAPLIIGVTVPLIFWDWSRGRLRDYEKS